MIRLASCNRPVSKLLKSKFGNLLPVEFRDPFVSLASKEKYIMIGNGGRVTDGN